MIAVASQPDQPVTRFASVVLRGVSWKTYQALVQELENQPNQRLTYNHGQLEIFMPLPPHGSYKRWTGRFVDIITEELGIEIRSMGSCTWSRQDLAKGVEADECYYIQNEASIRGKMVIDLTIDPPPDLAIEIDITSPSLPRLPLYGAIGVPEVWRFDGETVQLLSLVKGEYQSIPTSIALPMVTPAILETWLTQAQIMGETSWAKAVRRWIQALQPWAEGPLS